MMTKNLVKKAVVKEFAINDKDTGSSQVQVALLTDRIKQLTEHLQNNKHDFSSKKGLLAAVSNRRRLLSYLKRKNIDQYKSLIKKLGLRK